MGHSSIGNSLARSLVAFSGKGAKQLPYPKFLKRKEEGKCFRCRLKYGPLHKCPQRQLQVLIMAKDKLEDCELFETREEDMELTLQVMRGGFEPYTLKINGSIAGVPMIALIDSGLATTFCQKRLQID